MIKLVIADDEERVCRLIDALGDWDGLGIKVAGIAHNGVEALELLNKERVDILITDIRMPGYSGLELIERVRKTSDHTRIIIISGYASFEYAQTALKYGVNDYLLKPISRQGLNDSLRTLCAQILKEREQSRIQEESSQEREEELSRIRKTLLSDLINVNDLALSEDKLRDLYYFQARRGCYRVFILRMDCCKEKMEEETASHFWTRTEEIFLKETEKICFDQVLMQQGACLFGLIHYAPAAEESIRRTCRNVLNRIMARQEIFGVAELTLAMGEEVRDPSDLDRSLLSARRRVAERILEGPGKMIDRNVETQELFGKRLLDKFSREIGFAIDNLDKAGLVHACSLLRQQVHENKNAHGWEILELAMEAGTAFTRILELQGSREHLKKYQKACEDSTTVDQLFDTLQDFTVGQLEQFITAREEETARPIRVARQYIHQHYAEPITLEEVSEKAGLSPAYFSALFKKETDVGFAKYLINERIEAAKELLRETSLPVQDICRRVGYNDPKHFTHLFEKTTGVKPAVYRRLYG